MKKRTQTSPARRTGGKGRERLALALLPTLIAGIFSVRVALANPTGAQVVSGQATITSSGNVLTVTNTPGAIINWQAFSISAGEVTRFLQQSASSTVLNRVTGQDPSAILGSLQSNGRVFLINPNGILFGQNAQVNVGGLVASTLGISNADFLAGRLNFAAGDTAGSVVNQGNITTPAGGQVYLIAPQVQNTGIITTPQGQVILAAGHTVQLVDNADPNITLVISSTDDKAVNLGQVVASGGKVGIFGALVEQGGVVSADSAVAGQNGEILLKATKTVTLDGASVTSATNTAVGGTGGRITVEGNQVMLTDNARIDVSGDSGGGKVYLGGGFHGADAAITNADITYVGQDASIIADATRTGDGGQVAVWADGATFFYGNISARGGSLGGNGGFVETSGKNYLDYRGSVDLRAPKGTTGTLLLDPYSVTIDDTGSAPITPTGTNPVSYTSGADSDVTAASINAQLATANVIIEAGAGGGGSITVASNNLNWNNSNTLTLKASADVNINGSITGSSGTLELIATGGNIAQSAAVNVGKLLAVAGGDVNLNSTSNVVGTLAGSSGGSNGFVFAANDNIVVGAVAGAQSTVTGITATGTGGVSLTAGGTVNTSSATIIGPSLAIVSGSGVGSVSAPLAVQVGSLGITNGGSQGGGDIVVSNSGDLTLTNITQIASPQIGRIYISTDGAMTVGSHGITQNNGNAGAEIGLKAGAGITINGPIRNGAYTVGLVTTTGNIVEVNGGYIQASALSVSAAGGYIALNHSSNQIGVIGGTSSGDFSVNDDVGTTVVGVVTLINGSLIGQQNGINSTTGNIAVRNTGSLYLSNPVTATSGNIGLVASGGYVRQASSGTVNAASLSVNALADVDLTAANAVATIAGQSANNSYSIGGSFTFSSTRSFVVGQVSAIAGLVPAQDGVSALHGESVSLTSTTGSIGTATGSSISGAGLTLNTYNGVGSTGTPLATNVGSLNITNSAGGGAIVVANSGQSLTLGSITQSTSGDIVISNDTSTAGRTLTVSSALSTPLGNVSLAAGGTVQIDAPVSASGAVRLVSTSGDVSQSTSTASGGAAISAASLSASAAQGSVALENLNNSVATVAGSAASGWRLVDSGAVSVGTVAALGAIAAATGITTTTGTVLLQSGGAITRSGSATVTAPTVDLRATGNIGDSATPLLTNASTLIASGGDLYVSNSGTSALTVQQALGSGHVDIVTAGALNIGTGTNTANFTGTDLTMVAGGAMNIGASNVIDITGPVNLYAGYTQAAGATPVTNNAAVTMTIGASQVNGTAIDLWTNAVTSFQTGTAVFSVTPTYHPAPSVGGGGAGGGQGISSPGRNQLAPAQRPVMAAFDYSTAPLISSNCIASDLCWGAWQMPVWTFGSNQFYPVIRYPSNGFGS